MTVFFLINEIWFFKGFLQGSVLQSFLHGKAMALQMGYWIIAGLVILAGLDLLWEKFQYQKKLRQTHQQLREETKEKEGNPEIKQRIRSIQRKMAQSRMMQEVPKADVVLTNPSHISVAIKYHQGMLAPRVVAKGADQLAFKIRQLALRHGVPMVENAGLARTLYRMVPLGKGIPQTLYKAVAEVLAFVYGMGHRGGSRVMGGYFWQKVKGLTSNSDIFIAISLLVILAVMIVPINPFMLDIFLTTILALSMVILLVSVYTKRPLEFSTFPSILLVMTLFRLSLNMASTRNILLGGASVGPSAAGEIVRLFGDLVVGGNFAVGLIIFIIFFIINFIVVTKGAGRVAEVAARFTLDAMPGKQMAIDADLNAGLIDEQQAKRRRKEVAQEADFYGAMDGSSKFVRGDAIAGLFITFINIVGGIIIGMVQNSMSFSEASQIFALLTIGDGLVSQIPALVVSTAAGIIITRNTDEDSLGEQIAAQLRVHPKSLSIAACLLFALSWVGLPKLPFWSLALLLAWWAWRIERKSRALGLEREQQALEGKEGVGEDLEQLLPLDMCALEVGYGLIGVVDPQQDGDLLERIGNIRKQFALDWGVIIPSISILRQFGVAPRGVCF